MRLAEKQASLIADLNLIADPHERLSVVVSRASGAGLTESEKSEANRVAGCVSRVWITGTSQGGECFFYCEADSPMVKGLVALLCDLYSGCTPAEVIAEEPEMWRQCGFERLLSPTRLNGLRAVRERIRADARQFLEASHGV